MDTKTQRQVACAFALFGVSDFFTLSRAYAKVDQKLMVNGTWDANNPRFLTNRTRKILEKIDPAQLSRVEQIWRKEILWIWYHHAISFACTKKNRALGQLYATTALKLAGRNPPNKITRLLYLLVFDRVGAAKRHLATIRNKTEKSTGKFLVKVYLAGKFF